MYFFDFNHKILTFSVVIYLHASTLGSSVIQYHFYGNALFISPRVSYTVYLNAKGALAYITTNFCQN